MAESFDLRIGLAKYNVNYVIYIKALIQAVNSEVQG